MSGHQRKADATSLEASAPLPFDTVKSFEETRKFFFRNAYAGVADRQRRTVAVGVH